MIKNKKLSKTLLTAVTMLLTTGIFAIPKGPCDPKPDPTVCCQDPTPGPFAFSYAKDVSLSCPQDFYFNATFLLMQAKEDGLAYAIKQSDGHSNDFPLMDGDIQDYTTGRHNTNWNYGIRISSGFYLNHDAWDLGAAWTYFRINNDKGTRLDGGVLLPFFLDPGISTSTTCMDTSARLTGRLNTFDLRLGKPYHISRKVVFNPHFGVRFGWINQDYLVRNGGVFSYTVGETTYTDDGVEMIGKNDFCGVGARAGLDSELNLGAGFSLFGNVAAALLYSHFDIHQSVTFDTAIRSQLKHDFYTVTPNSEISLGICWNKRLNKGRHLLSLKGAYEFHAWFDQNRMRRFYDATRPSANDESARANLYLHGFAFTVGFEF